MPRPFIVISAFILVALLAIGAIVSWIHSSFTAPGLLANDSILIVERGSGGHAIARQLNRAAVIGDPFIFKVGVRLFSDAVPMKAGEYLFPAGVSPENAVRILQAGKTVTRRVTIAEGLSSADVSALLRRTMGLTGSLLAQPREGSLLPETYNFSFGDTRRTLVERMQESQRKLLDDLWRGRREGLPFNFPEEAMILASIVEKETGVKGERARVAAVFVNRLRKKMRLQSDPTVVYGITKGKKPLGRSLTRSDLKQPTPYNTYTIKGLPPTPIANPGRESLRAVLHPLDSDELYFVADGTGGHVFARTLAQHNRNVARWRKLKKKRKSGG